MVFYHFDKLHPHLIFESEHIHFIKYLFFQLILILFELECLLLFLVLVPFFESFTVLSMIKSFSFVVTLLWLNFLSRQLISQNILFSLLLQYVFYNQTLIFSKMRLELKDKKNDGSYRLRCVKSPCQ